MKYLLFFLIMSCATDTNEQIKTLFVADHLADCTGVGEQKCMLIKESETEDWTYLYQQIEGFDYEPGYFYQLKVGVSKVDHPPADGSGLRYKLKEVVSKVAAQNQDELNGSWKVVQIQGLEKIDIHPTLEFNANENRISGFAGCNNYFASYEVMGEELTIGPAGATRKMCQEMTVEDAFLPMLGEVATHKLEDKELQLFDGSGNLILVAVAND